MPKKDFPIQLMRLALSIFLFVYNIINETVFLLAEEKGGQDRNPGEPNYVS